VAVLEDSGAAEGACLLAGGASALARGESWATAEVPTVAAMSGGGGIVGARTM
jgi:hypothetical protein